MANKTSQKRKTTVKTKKKSSSRKNKSRLPKWALLIIGIIVAIILIANQTTISSQRSSDNIDYGDITTVLTASNTQEHLVKYTGMTVSFNPTMHIPNWVAWELTGEETRGTEQRKNKFLRDENVPGCPDHWDYSYSGYDRGHMAPAADMKWSDKAMEESFLLTNICPQAKSLNSGAWGKLEDKCRTWAQVDSAIVIVCGPILNDKITEHIGDSRVAVPKRFFKVILSPYANPPRGIGFIMPNAKVPGGMQAAAVTIDSVETVTGHDFFQTLPDEIESQVESQCKFHQWSILRKRK